MIVGTHFLSVALCTWSTILSPTCCTADLVTGALEFYAGAHAVSLTASAWCSVGVKSKAGMRNVGGAGRLRLGCRLTLLRRASSSSSSTYAQTAPTRPPNLRGLSENPANLSRSRISDLRKIDVPVIEASFARSHRRWRVSRSPFSSSRRPWLTNFWSTTLRCL